MESYEKKAKEHEEEIPKVVVTCFTQVAESGWDMHLICLAREMMEMDGDCLWVWDFFLGE